MPVAIREETITFAMLGDVTLDALEAGLGQLRKCLSALERDYAGGRRVEWLLEDLEKSSAIATFAGKPAKPDSAADVEAVIAGYEAVGRGLETGDLASLPKGSAEAARNLAALIGGGVVGLRLESDHESFEAISPGEPSVGSALARSPHRPAWGEVRGRVQSMSNRRGLRFTIYDIRTDRPVVCHVPKGFEEKMRDAWGRDAVVSGKVKRHPETGLPVAVTEVRDVVLAPAFSGGWRDAMGCFKGLAGADEPAEVAIRRLRDGW